jgi:fatty acid desaturase
MATTGEKELSVRVRKVEWLTISLIGGVYAVLGALVWFHAFIPWWALLPVGAYAAALHSSLQHEVLHGHPTRNRALNEALVFLTPTFWLPYGCYRDTHLVHHNDNHLTDPTLDPESYYVLPETWAAMPGIKRALYNVNQTLGGRMLIGPAVGIARFWTSEWKAIIGGNFKTLPCWIVFGVSSILILSYVVLVCGMPFWKYYFLIAYPGISLALVRSYCEHQAAEDLGGRTIIVEASPFWSLLFLNNNLHAAHHARPNLPWYSLPSYYRNEREKIIQLNKGYLVLGYGDIFREYFLRAKEPVPYPNEHWLKN